MLINKKACIETKNMTSKVKGRTKRKSTAIRKKRYDKGKERLKNMVILRKNIKKRCGTGKTIRLRFNLTRCNRKFRHRKTFIRYRKGIRKRCGLGKTMYTRYNNIRNRDNMRRRKSMVKSRRNISYKQGEGKSMYIGFNHI